MNDNLQTALTIFIIVVAVLLVLSAIAYVFIARHVIKTQKKLFKDFDKSFTRNRRNFFND